MIVLGHKFVPMTASDWQTFSGAEEGSLICYVPDLGDGVDRTLLLNPVTGEIIEHFNNADGHCAEYIWDPPSVINIEDAFWESDARSAGYAFAD